MTGLPIIYIRGFAGPTSGIDEQVDDPFYGFNKGSTHVRVDGDGDPSYYQYEGPLLRLMIDHGYRLLVQGDQRRVLARPDGPRLPWESLWVHRFYDSAATTFTPARHEGVLQRAEHWLTRHVGAPSFDLERAADDLYVLVQLVRARTGAPKVHLVAHSMGGLIARCMIQKICEAPRAGADGRPTTPEHARDVVDKLFTFGTPHGGIATELPAANRLMEDLGPAGSDIFSPPKMYGYLTPGATYGEDLAPDGWDPRDVDPEVFPPDRIFCLVGTDPVDYGASRYAIGPRSDGLVRIENAYVRGAHRAYVYKSHSGAYGEVNSEEGYQNLRRFLFGRWAVALCFRGLPGPDVLEPGVSWQADMRLAVRGLPVVMSEQQAAHWCPIILDQELHAGGEQDTTDAPVPVVSTFLLDREPPGGGAAPSPADTLCRYVVTLRVGKTVQHDGAFDFRDHLEQVSDWADSLVVDVGPGPDGALGAWVGWNSQVLGALDAVPRMPQQLELQPRADGTLAGTIALPDAARALPIFGATPDRLGDASLVVTVARRPAPPQEPDPSAEPDLGQERLSAAQLVLGVVGQRSARMSSAS